MQQQLNGYQGLEPAQAGPLEPMSLKVTIYQMRHGPLHMGLPKRQAHSCCTVHEFSQRLLSPLTRHHLPFSCFFVGFRLQPFELLALFTCAMLYNLFSICLLFSPSLVSFHLIMEPGFRLHGSLIICLKSLSTTLRPQSKHSNVPSCHAM